MPRPGWLPEDIYRIAERGYSLHQQGRYREATTIFDGLVAADPQNSYCRDALAAAWLALGEPQRALEQLDLILKRDSGHLSARARRFEAYLEIGDFAAARADFEILKHLLPAHEVRRLSLRFETAIRRATMPPNSR
jgi:tetratricopeptide (TPR) repeat protein